MEAVGTSAPEPQRESTNRRTYGVEGRKISVAWKTYSSELTSPEKPDAARAVLFIPGWSITENADSLKKMGQQFADYSGSRTFMVDTTTENTTESNLVDEAKALSLFIQEQGLTNLTLVGNSQGGAEAIHLVALLQEQHPDIKIEGLVLFDPVTLTQQSRRKLLTNYVKDILRTNTALTHVPRMGENNHVHSQNTKYVKDGITGILKSVIHSNVLGWPAKVWKELTEMAKQNPDLGKIKTPVIIIQGEYDRVSDPRMTAPKNPQKPNEGYIEDLGTREERLKSSAGQDIDPQILTREDYLRKTLFPNSPYIRMVVPRKMGYHNVSFSRPEPAARTALYLLKRHHREEEVVTS